MAIAYAFTHASVLDGTEHMQVQHDMTVLVNDSGFITELAPSASTPVPSEAQDINLNGAWITPGMVNLSAHLCGDGTRKTSGGARGFFGALASSIGLGLKTLRQRVQEASNNELMSGVTTLRTSGDPDYCDLHERDRVKAGVRRGPRMRVCGPGATVPGGYGSEAIGIECATKGDAIALVEEAARRGCDHVQLFVTRGVHSEGDPGTVTMPLETARAACERAHAHDMSVSAYAVSPEGVKLALRAGADIIERGAELDDEALDLFRANGDGRPAMLITSLSPTIPFVRLPADRTRSTPQIIANSHAVLASSVACARACLDAHIFVGLGSGAGHSYVTHYDFWREVVYFQQLLGVSSTFALHTATLRNAQVMLVDHITGSVKPGKSADLLFFGDNPLEDLEILREPAMIMTRGDLVPMPDVHRYHEIDAGLDSVLYRV